MKTYLKIFFNSEGASPSEVRDQLMNMGFEPIKGNYDFVYDWNRKNVDVSDLVWFADKVHNALKGCKVLFSIETI
ncbi:MAG: hypothetical protein DRN00_01925 [Thermoplasmata archaeon]|mgnify:CR=1 FL=1|nr:MAG: hypothetical protein DRN03_04570 [Thermoplasmata archaeon]RLF39423.1 MAG: hypothetical protein DRN00_01925 [Thermoplasmata archaeon]